MMRTARMLGGLAVVLVSAWAARADPMKVTITVPEVMVRSGPSPEFYATNKLRQGDAVGVVGDEVTGWLAIVPPTGSFSWINTRQVEQIRANAAVVSAAEAQIWVGSRLSNSEPTVCRAKVTKGTQLTVIGKAEPARDGKWLPILPAPSEVRYIPAEAVRPSAALSQFAAAPPGPTKSSSSPAGFASPQLETAGSAAVPPAATPTGPPSPPAPSNSANSLWIQAEDAERAGNSSQAQALLEELAQQVKSTDHDLWMRCLNRIRALQDRRRNILTAQPPTHFPAAANANSGTVADRLVPSPAGSPAPPSSALSPPQPPRASSEYCYLQDSGYTARLSPPVVSAPSPPPPSGQRSELGCLRRTLISLDGRPLFCLQPIDASKRHMYVTAAANVNLEPYVEKNVYLYGRMVYRGDLRTNYMTVFQVSPVP